MNSPVRPIWTQTPGPVLILGPAYAGKSEFAMQALRPDQTAVVIGTAPPTEPAFKERLQYLQSMRPGAWETLYAGTDIAGAAEAAAQRGTQVLIDAVNQWLAALLLSGDASRDRDTAELLAWLDERVGDLLRVVHGFPSQRFVLVSAEVGGGAAPARAPERLYRQAVGLCNQRLARAANTVVSIQAGLPTLLKGGL